MGQKSNSEWGEKVRAQLEKVRGRAFVKEGDLPRPRIFVSFHVIFFSFCKKYLFFVIIFVFRWKCKCK